MYNTKRLKEFIERFQKEIDIVCEKFEEELQNIVEDELLEGDKFWMGNGTVLIEDIDDNKIENEFVNILGNFGYNDFIETGICLNNFSKNIL